MAKMSVCAVFDSAVQVYGQPFFVVSTGGAVRSFSDEVNRADANNQFNKHPDDFDLRFLAYYDDETGEFSSLAEGIRSLARGKDVVVRGDQS